MIKSLSTHLFVYYELEAAIFEHISKGGFDTVELWSMRPHLDYHSDALINGLENWLGENNLQAKSAHLPMYKHRNDSKLGKFLRLSDKNKQIRRDAIDETVIAAQAMTSLGINLLVIHTGINENDPSDAEKWLEDSVHEVLDKTGSKDAKILVENTPTGLNGMKRLKNQAETLPSCGICLDLGHANMGHDPVEMIKFFGHNILSVHASDNDGENDAHLKPGHGKIEFRKCIKAFKEIGFGGTIVYELRDYEEGKVPHETHSGSISEVSRFHDRISTD